LTPSRPIPPFPFLKIIIFGFFSLSETAFSMMFRSTLVLRRKFTSSATLLQQYQQRATTFRGFSPNQAEAPEETDEPVETAPRFASNRPIIRPASTPSIDSGKPYINPFPEELTQDYSSATLFHGASEAPFSKEVIETLHAELSPEDIEIKPDGAAYLPENRYRKILCKAFGAGGWCLVPRGAHSLGNGVLSREYALFCEGRFISQARGHATIMGFSNPAMASEVVRSNALMRVCKDLGVGNELWDPSFVANWRAEYAIRRTENGKIRWYKKDQPQ
jgi:hypothetical protein